MFVDFQDKEDLIVQVNSLDDCLSFFDTMSLEITKNVKVPEYVDGVTADFTTTTAVQKIVSQITLMSSLQGYFNFCCIIGCGIPAIEMTGTEDDWKKLLSKLKVLKALLEPITDDVGLTDTWWSLATEIFEKLLETYRGQPDEDWWSRIISNEQPFASGQFLRSGPPRYSGWIVRFLKGVAGKEFRTLPVEILRRVRGGKEVGTGMWDFPSSVVTLPLHIVNLMSEENDKGALVAGMVGLTVHESVGNDRVSVQPFQGWSLLLPKDSPFRPKRPNKPNCYVL